MLEKAIEIAVKAHKGQKDLNNHPYILHPLRVMLMCETEEEMIVGVLHDVIDKTELTIDDIREIGFYEVIIEALDCLRIQADESYDDFIDRVLKNPLASKIKLLDLDDNMDLSRIENLMKINLEKLENYHHAVDKLEKVVE